MSLSALNWAMGLPIKPSNRKFVLVCLADYAVETGKTYPSMGMLSKTTGMGTEAITTAINSLIEDKIISDTGKRAGEQREIVVYQLNQISLDDLKPTPKVRKPLKNEAMAEADKIYQIYPRKIGRPKALASIVKMVKQYGFENVMSGTELFAKAWAESGKVDLSFCPHPSTWYNQERFNDAPEAWGLTSVKKIVDGPTYAEVENFVKDKEMDVSKVASWSIGFYNHGKKVNWQRNGKPMEWQIELQGQIAKWRQQR